MKLTYASVIARDIAALCDFYAAVLDAPVLVDQATPIYRAIDLGGTTLAFSAEAVYALLGIEDWSGAKGTRQYLTFGVDDGDELDLRTKVRGLGGGSTLERSLRHELRLVPERARRSRGQCVPVQLCAPLIRSASCQNRLTVRISPQRTTFGA